MSETITFEEKKQQVAATILKNEAITEDEEFAIIANQGVKYVLYASKKKDLELYVEPMKMNKYHLLFAISQAPNLPTVQEQSDKVNASLSEIFIEQLIDIEDGKEPTDEQKKEAFNKLKPYIDREDVEKLVILLSAGVWLGKAMFKKKLLKMSEAQMEVQKGIQLIASIIKRGQ